MLSLHKKRVRYCHTGNGRQRFFLHGEEIQSLGKRVENASFKSTSSYLLRKVCDRFTHLDDYLDRFIVEERVEVSQEVSFWEKVLRLWKR
jgi:hypothetical protein